MSQQNQGQADPTLAVQYLGEVASTYAETLKPVEKGPFINQVNICLKVLTEDRETILAELKRVSEQLEEALATPDDTEG